MKRELGPMVERVAVALRDLAGVTGGTSGRGPRWEVKRWGMGLGDTCTCLLPPGDGLSTVLCYYSLFEIECCGKKKDTGAR